MTALPRDIRRVRHTLCHTILQQGCNGAFLVLTYSGKDTFFKFCLKIPLQRRPRICRPVPAQPDRLLVRRPWHAVTTRLPHPPRTRASSAQPCSTLPGRSTNPRFFGPSLISMQKPPPATFCPPPICACCRMRSRLTACCFYMHPAPLHLWASSASPCSTLSGRWTNPGVFGLFVDRMHKQPHATFCTPSACAFGRTQPRVPPYCFYARSTPPRMRASLALPCSSLPDRRHATPQFFHPSIDTIPKKMPATSCIPPYLRLQPSTTAGCGMLVLHMFHTAAPSPTWSMHVPPVSANSHLPLLLLICGVFCPSPFHHRRPATMPASQKGRWRRGSQRPLC